MNYMSLNIQGLGHKAKKGWIKQLCWMHKINFVALQETKMESIDLFSIKMLWGNLAFDHVVSSSIGNSGGILCVWDSNMFIKKHVSSLDYFLAIMGTWIPTSTKLLVISIYAPQELSEKLELWGYLCSLINRWDGETVVLVDFNEARTEQERFGSTFNIQGANALNNFISLAGLVDLPLGGSEIALSFKSSVLGLCLRVILFLQACDLRFEPLVSGKVFVSLNLELLASMSSKLEHLNGIEVAITPFDLQVVSKFDSYRISHSHFFAMLFEEGQLEGFPIRQIVNYLKSIYLNVSGKFHNDIALGLHCLQLVN
ncbi:RNA-directed DNA polymerase, eukaryota [Tanacetum coccineum]